MTTLTIPTAVMDAAVHYLRLGYSIVPCAGKKAAIPWAALTQRRPTHNELWHWYHNRILQNVGIVCGAVSGGLVVVDLDGDSAVARFRADWPHLFNTWAVRSGSGHGLHLYLKVSAEVPPTTKTTGLDWGNVEVRSNGAYVVAPPSVHPDSGQLYAVETYLPILRLDNLDDLCAWVKHENASKRVVQPVPKPMPAIEEVKAVRWAQAALAGECANVRSAVKGNRNDTLNRAAFKMGQLIEADKLRRDDVEAALFLASAALVAEDGEEVVNRTIRSGINAGLEHPRNR